MSQELFKWTFQTKKERSSAWYIAAFAVVIGLVIWGFITRQYWMSFVIMLLAGVAFFIENNSSDSVEIIVSELWIQIGTKFYDFSKITSFSYLYDGSEVRVLRLKINKKTLPILDLDIDNSIAIPLKNILVNYIKEDEKWEFTMSDKLIDF